MVSDKGINKSEVNVINEYDYSPNSSLKQRLKEVNQIGFTEDNENFPEGTIALKQHLTRERNKKVIELAKNDS